MLSGIGELLAAGYHQRVVWYIDDAFQRGHLFRVYLRGGHVTHEKQLGLAMVDDVMYLLWSELVLYGYGHRSISERGQEGYTPMRAVTAT